MVQIREATTEGDVRAVAGLFAAYSEWCRQQFVESGLVTRDDPRLRSFNDETLPGAFVRPDGFLLLALVGEVPAGCAFLRRLSTDACEMKRFYTRPRFRGLGVGTRLLDGVIRRATDMEYRRLQITSHPFMAAAQALYRRRGFYDIPPFLPPGLNTGDTNMALDLPITRSRTSSPASRADRSARCR